VVTPQRGSRSSRIAKQEPKRLRAATTRSPARTSARRALKTAAIPLAVGKQASAPSSSFIRSPKPSTVGLLNRE
jgi:hypothetical protein